MSKADKKLTVMDPSIREDVTGTVHVNKTRVCWALKTLVAEVLELFPETPVEYSNPDGRNTMLDGSFDLTGSDDPVTLSILLDLTKSDSRIEEVIEEDDQVLVSFKSSPRTQDSREPFGLADALLVLAEDETP